MISSATLAGHWLPFAIVVAYGVWFAARTRLVAARANTPIYSFGAPGSVQRASESAFRLAFGGALVLVCVRVALPQADRWVGSIDWLAGAIPEPVAVAILMVGAVLAAASQLLMGGSWRIGSAGDTQGELVTTGPFGFSRNPVFLGMRIMLFGLFLVAPSAISLALAVLGWFATEVQVRAEEEVLAARHGEGYRAYQRAVPRWITMPLGNPHIPLGSAAAGAALVFDQITKGIVAHSIAFADGIEVLPFFNIVHVVNRGVSFGLLAAGSEDAVTTLIVGTATVSAGVAIMMLRSRDRLETLAFGSILGGAIGNLIDRIRFGGVTDFLDFHYSGWPWPAFNLADVAIFAGCCLLFLANRKQTNVPG